MGSLYFDLVNPSETFFYDFTAPIGLYGAQGFLVENCTINNNTTTGFQLSADHDFTKDIVWRDCIISGNSSTFETCDGLHMSGSVANTIGDCLPEPVVYPFGLNTNVNIERCTSVGNIGGSFPSRAFGFYLAFGRNVQYIDCYAAGNSSKTILDGGFGVEGLLPGGESENVSYLRCTAQENGNLGATSVSAGFLCERTSRNILYRECTATSNGKTPARSSGGFVIFPRSGPGGENVPELGIKDIVLDNCIALNNGNVDSTASGGFVAYRPVEQAWTRVSNVVAQQCTSNQNQGAGFNIVGNIPGVVLKESEADLNSAAGFDVSTNSNPVLVTGNIAYNNETGNYHGVNPNIIEEGTQDSLPVSVGARNLSATSTS